MLAAEVVVTPHTHTWPESSTHTPRKLFPAYTNTHSAQTPNKPGPVPHQWLKRRGAQLTLVPRRGRANTASSPSLAPPLPSAADAAAFIVLAPSASHLTFHSSNARPSPGLRVTALVYSSDLNNLARSG